MSIRIKSLNADSSFWVGFSPPHASENLHGYYPGSFTILIDPWLTKTCKIINSKIARTEHTTPACIQSLSELPTPDVVIISQDKPDHCNQSTLQQLRPDTDTLILGPQAAVKKIRSWKHFDPLNVQSLKRFDEKQGGTIYRIGLPPISPTGSAGEVTVTFMAGRMDMKGLHNAVGITYRPPSSVLSFSTRSYVNLPLTPPATPSRPVTPKSTTAYPPPFGSREKTLSVIYSPHGVNYNVIKPYAIEHLLSESALPLNVLLHSFDRASNPWYLGGNIVAGVPNGAEIAAELFAKAWISAHDEEKMNSGLSTKGLKVTKFSVDDVKEIMKTLKKDYKSSNATRVVTLGAGEEYYTGSSKCATR